MPQDYIFITDCFDNQCEYDSIEELATELKDRLTDYNIEELIKLLKQ